MSRAGLGVAVPHCRLRTPGEHNAPTEATTVTAAQISSAALSRSGPRSDRPAAARRVQQQRAQRVVRAHPRQRLGRDLPLHRGLPQHDQDVDRDAADERRHARPPTAARPAPAPAAGRPAETSAARPSRIGRFGFARIAQRRRRPPCRPTRPPSTQDQPRAPPSRSLATTGPSTAKTACSTIDHERVLQHDDPQPLAGAELLPAVLQVTQHAGRLRRRPRLARAAAAEPASRPADATSSTALSAIAQPGAERRDRRRRRPRSRRSGRGSARAAGRRWPTAAGAPARPRAPRR